VRINRRRRYRRNPGVGLMPLAKEAFVDALWITAGQMGTRVVYNVLPASVKTSVGGTGQVAVQAASALGVGWLASRFLGSRVGVIMTAGALSQVVQTLIKTYAPGTISGLLSGAGDFLGYPSLTGYPSLPGVGAYPQLQGADNRTVEAGGGMGDDFDYYNS